MNFELPALPFTSSDLAPYLSEETINFHYGKHHKTYVDNLNKLIVDTKFENNKLEEIIKSATGPIFNNAAQIWNHNFYWNCLKKPGNNTENHISLSLQEAFNKYFGSFEKFKEDFTKSALGLFGSGWVWLVQDTNDELSILATENANNPLLYDKIPLLTCDVWEHAYYIDYRNARTKYLEAFWEIVNLDIKL
jgi:Fe-Mn family superoxide dismutase